MLFVEMLTDKLETIQQQKNKSTISYYINPITDINILKQELNELKQANNNIKDLKQGINYLDFFKMELDFIKQIHDQYYKTDVIINNNNLIVIDPNFKKYCILIKRELKGIIKQLEKLENK